MWPIFDLYLLSQAKWWIQKHVRPTRLVAMSVIPFFVACVSSNTTFTSSQSSLVPLSPHEHGYGDVPYFKRGSDNLDTNARATLSLVTKLILRERIRVNIVGHADNCDDETTNLELSQRRAKVVKQELLLLGVPEDMIVSVSGIGSSQKYLGVKPCSLPYNDRVDIDVADL